MGFVSRLSTDGSAEEGAEGLAVEGGAVSTTTLGGMEILENQLSCTTLPFK